MLLPLNYDKRCCKLSDKRVLVPSCEKRSSSCCFSYAGKLLLPLFSAHFRPFFLELCTLEKNNNLEFESANIKYQNEESLWARDSSNSDGISRVRFHFSNNFLFVPSLLPVTHKILRTSQGKGNVEI